MEKTFGGPADDIGTKVAQLKDGSLVVAGATRSGGSGTWMGWLLCLDIKGNLLWDKRFGPGELNSFSNLAVTEDGGIALSGVTSSKANGRAGWLMRADNRGKVLWDKKIGAPGSRYDASNVAALPNGGVAVAGSVRLDNLTSQAWAARLDRQGKEIWKIAYEGNGKEQAWGIAPAPDDGLIVAGQQVTRDLSADAEPWVFRLNKQGTKLWSKTYGGKGQASSVSAIPAGGFVVVGNKAIAGKDGYLAWVARLDGNGNVVWERTFGEQMQNFGAGVEVLPDGGIIVAGTASASGANAGEGQGWLFTIPPADR